MEEDRWTEVEEKGGERWRRKGGLRWRGKVGNDGRGMANRSGGDRVGAIALTRLNELDL